MISLTIKRHILLSPLSSAFLLVFNAADLSLLALILNFSPLIILEVSIVLYMFEVFLERMTINKQIVSSEEMFVSKNKIKDGQFLLFKYLRMY